MVIGVFLLPPGARDTCVHVDFVLIDFHGVLAHSTLSRFPLARFLRKKKGTAPAYT